jgi:hypothetical protein
MIQFKRVNNIKQGFTKRFKKNPVKAGTEIKGSTPVSYAMDYIRDTLPDYEGSDAASSDDIVMLLMEEPKANGSVNFDAYEARLYMVEWANDVIALKKDLGMKEDILEEPEMYMVYALGRAVETILAKLEGDLKRLLSETDGVLTSEVIDYIDTKVHNMNPYGMFIA